MASHDMHGQGFSGGTHRVTVRALEAATVHMLGLNVVLDMVSSNRVKITVQTVPPASSSLPHARQNHVVQGWE